MSRPPNTSMIAKVLLGVLLVASLLSLFRPRTYAQPADPEPLRSIEGWGRVYDPQEDCRLAVAEDRLSIVVPGTLHDLSVEQGQVEAPRVLQGMEGDFVARVTVAGALRPGGDRTARYAHPYHGAGLLLWSDGHNYVRMERAAIRRGSQLISYINFEQRRQGRMLSSEATAIPDAPQILRLERQGQRLFASFSPDGERWTPLPEMAIDFAPGVRVGVAAVNTATLPLTAEFESLEVTAIDAPPAPEQQPAAP